MTAPNPSDVTTVTAEPGGDGTGDAGDTLRAGQSLSREGLEAELRRARDEAAKFRTRLGEFGDDETYQRAKDAVAAVEKAEAEKKTEVERLTEKNEGLLHRSATVESELMKLRVALGAGVAPDQVDEFASRLRGDDEDALKADAVQLSQFFASTSTPARRGDPSQGAGGSTAPVSDPLQQALESKLGIG